MGADLGPGDEQREEGRPVLSWPPDRLARTSPLNKSDQDDYCDDDDDHCDDEDDYRDDDDEYCDDDEGQGDGEGFYDSMVASSSALIISF